MATADPLTAWGAPAADCCAYIVDDEQAERCGEPCALASSYCPSHHDLTHIAIGSKAEAATIKTFNAIAKAAGGRIGGRGAILGPLPGEIEEIERHSLFAILNWHPRTGRRPPP